MPGLANAHGNIVLFISLLCKLSLDSDNSLSTTNYNFKHFFQNVKVTCHVQSNRNYSQFSIPSIHDRTIYLKQFDNWQFET